MDFSPKFIGLTILVLKITYFFGKRVKNFGPKSFVETISDKGHRTTLRSYVSTTFYHRSAHTKPRDEVLSNVHQYSSTVVLHESVGTRVK